MTAHPPKILQNLIADLSELIEAPTLTTSPRVSASVLKELVPRFKRAGMRCVTGSNKGFPYLYAHSRPLDETKVWLYAHLDVVEGEKEQFKLRRDGGRLYGRGSFDMKFAIAAYLQLYEELSEKHAIGVIITSDEEHSGSQGSGFLASKLGLAGKTIIIPDGGGIWEIERMAKGAIWVHVETKGKAVHAARLDLGKNAIDEVYRVMDHIKDALGSGDGSEFAHTTVSVGRVTGGDAINLVPKSAQADLDIRFVPPLTLKEVKTKLAAVARQTGATITTSSAAEASQHQIGNPETLRLRMIMAKHIGRPVEFVDSYGASDAQYFTAAGANPIVFYPEGHGHHTNDEYITERGLLQFYEILREFIGSV